MGASAVGPDPLDAGGSGVGQRLIPLEPMSIVLNLGISREFFLLFDVDDVDADDFGIANWQDIDLSTMMFPAEFLIDYVRVYQRKDEINLGCDPKEFPTAKYINEHLEAYSSEAFFL
jgi:hypothetical protein